jgi:hypothetical protein
MPASLEIPPQLDVLAERLEGELRAIEASLGQPDSENLETHLASRQTLLEDLEALLPEAASTADAEAIRARLAPVMLAEQRLLELLVAEQARIARELDDMRIARGNLDRIADAYGGEA